MKIALIFWGLARSLNMTIKSIQNNILNILKNNNIQFHIFFHTYFINSIYNNPRSNENNIKINNNLYKLLDPNFFIYDIQDTIDIDFQSLFPNKDPWNNNFTTFKNYILALYSLKRISDLFLHHHDTQQYDLVIFLRPDVLFTKPIDINWFKLINNNTILTPKFHTWNGINDRFAIMKPNNLLHYGYRFDYLKLKLPYTSEILLKHIINKNYIKNIHIDFIFKRIRANGKIQNIDKKL